MTTEGANERIRPWFTRSTMLKVNAKQRLVPRTIYIGILAFGLRTVIQSRSRKKQKRPEKMTRMEKPMINTLTALMVWPGCGRTRNRIIAPMSIRETPNTNEKNPLTLISNSEESTTREMKAPDKAPMMPDSTASTLGFLMQPMLSKTRCTHDNAACAFEATLAT